MNRSSKYKLTKDLVRQRVNKYHTTKYLCENLHLLPHYHDYEHLKKFPKAGLLVPLFYRDDELHVLLTKRSMKVTSHKGDVAFPGGKMDPEDADEIQTALREAHEEIGLDPSTVEVLGCFHQLVAYPGVMCTPVLTFIQDDFVVKTSEEVDDVFHLPLQRFLSTEGSSTRIFDFNGPSTVHYFNDVVNGKRFVTWGLTANMCIYTAMAILDRKPDFDFYANEHFENGSMWTGLENRLLNGISRFSKL